jgi:hypothetical protein
MTAAAVGAKPRHLPASVRYVKNGPGGGWWKLARARNQVHAGWQEVPDQVLLAGDVEAARPFIEAYFNGKPGGQGAVTRDLNALRSLLDRPSRHVWVTFQDRRMWWCTVRDGVVTSDESSTDDHGHFWLTCDRPWSDRSVDGARQLFMSELPGIVTRVAGYRATICEPEGWKEILRVIKNEDDPLVSAAREARAGYEGAIEALIGQLRDKDFELLIDLILSRDGWARVGPLAGTMADIDTEVENRSMGEIAFIQVKSSADQATLNDYVARFREQRDRYARMIFAVHKAIGKLAAPAGEPIQVWTRTKIAELVVALGLGPWLEKRV